MKSDTYVRGLCTVSESKKFEKLNNVLQNAFVTYNITPKGYIYGEPRNENTKVYGVIPALSKTYNHPRGKILTFDSDMVRFILNGNLYQKGTILYETILGRIVFKLYRNKKYYKLGSAISIDNNGDYKNFISGFGDIIKADLNNKFLSETIFLSPNQISDLKYGEIHIIMGKSNFINITKNIKNALPETLKTTDKLYILNLSKDILSKYNIKYNNDICVLKIDSGDCILYYIIWD